MSDSVYPDPYSPQSPQPQQQAQAGQPAAPQAVPASQPQASPAAPSPQPAYRPSQMGQLDGYDRAVYGQPAAQAQQAASAYQAPRTAQQPPRPQAQPAAGSSSSAPKKQGGRLKTFLAGFGGALAGTLLVLSLWGAFVPAGSTSQSTVLGGESGATFSVEGEDITLAEAVSAKTLPSVVCIYVYSEQTSFGWFGPTTSGEELSSLGSGVILSEDGYVLTNYHVIEGETSLKVSVNDQQYDAKVVGTDATSDLAVIQIQGANDLTPMEIGSSSDLKVGEWVMSVGSPYGMEQSVATGIVSAVSRSSASLQSSDSTAIYANLIQTDAAINPGNSGGALVDKDGKLVGINTLIASYSGSYSGVGFAIPSDYAVTIARQIIDGEEPSHAQLGVSLVSIDSATARRYNLAVNEGAYVTNVYSGAAEAGIQEGDIITKVDGKAATSATDVILAVRSHNPGDTVSVELNRDGETVSVDVNLTSDTAKQG